MKPLRRRRAPARTTSIRPAERYLAAGAAEARRLGHTHVGTEHVLLALARDRGGGAAEALRELGVTYGDLEESACVAPASAPAPRIDADALATLGIDYEAVRERVEATFGIGALEQAGTPCLGVAPRLKVALAYAVDRAGRQPIEDTDVLLALLTVRDSLAASMLAGHGVTLERAADVVAGKTPPAGYIGDAPPSSG